MGSPRWKVYEPGGRLVATAASTELAAVCAHWCGTGTRVKDGWRRRRVAYRVTERDRQPFDVALSLREYARNARGPLDV